MNWIARPLSRAGCWSASRMASSNGSRTRSPCPWVTWMLVATMLGWIDTMVNQPGLDFAPKGGSDYKPQELRTSEELVEALDGAVAKARAALSGTTDEHLMRVGNRIRAVGAAVSAGRTRRCLLTGVCLRWPARGRPPASLNAPGSVPGSRRAARPAASRIASRSPGGAWAWEGRRR